MASRESRANDVLAAVAETLSEYPDGLSLRALARESRLKLSTLRYHLERSLVPYVDDSRLGPQDKPFVRLIRLRPGATARQNRLLQRIMREMEK